MHLPPLPLLLGLLVAIMPTAAGGDAFAAFGASAVAPPQPAAEFRLPDLGERVTALSEFKGRLVLLNFWATWCAPCREEMPGLERLARRYRTQGLTVLAVNEDSDGKTRVARFAARLGLSFPILMDRDGAVAKRYRATALPTTFLIGTDGRVIATVAGARDWDGPAAAALIEALLGADSISLPLRPVVGESTQSSSLCLAWDHAASRPAARPKGMPSPAARSGGGCSPCAFAGCSSRPQRDRLAGQRPLAVFAETTARALRSSATRSADTHRDRISQPRCACPLHPARAPGQCCPAPVRHCSSCARWSVPLTASVWVPSLR